MCAAVIGGHTEDFIKCGQPKVRSRLNFCWKIPTWRLEGCKRKFSSLHLDSLISPVFPRCFFHSKIHTTSIKRFVLSLQRNACNRVRNRDPEFTEGIRGLLCTKRGDCVVYYQIVILCRGPRPHHNTRTLWACSANSSSKRRDDLSRAPPSWMAIDFPDAGSNNKTDVNTLRVWKFVLPEVSFWVYY